MHSAPFCPQTASHEEREPSFSGELGSEAARVACGRCQQSFHQETGGKWASVCGMKCGVEPLTKELGALAVLKQQPRYQFSGLESRSTCLS